MEEIKSKTQSFWELVRFALIALIVVFFIRSLIADPFIVSGASMIPTFENGDYLIIDELSYKLSDPKRNDVVVFQYPGDPKNNPERNFILRFFDPGKYFIKRVIGLPNETIEIKGNDVTITNNEHEESFKLDQPFVKNPANNDTYLELKSDEYFVLGDNRSGSSDSRAWGPVKREFFTGKAFLRLLPISKISIWPGDYKQVE